MGDNSLHIVIHTLIRGIEQLDGPIPAVTEIHVADSIVLVCDRTLHRTAISCVNMNGSS
jgi:hypothetical protein